METIASFSALMFMAGFTIFIISSFPAKREKVMLDSELQLAHGSMELDNIIKYLEHAHQLVELHRLEKFVKVEMLRSTLDYAHKMLKNTASPDFVTIKALRDTIAEIEVSFTDTKPLEKLGNWLMVIGSVGLGFTVLYDALVQHIMFNIARTVPNI